MGPGRHPDPGGRVRPLSDALRRDLSEFLARYAAMAYPDGLAVSNFNSGPQLAENVAWRHTERSKRGIINRIETCGASGIVLGLDPPTRIAHPDERKERSHGA